MCNNFKSILEKISYLRNQQYTVILSSTFLLALAFKLRLRHRLEYRSSICLKVNEGDLIILYLNYNFIEILRMRNSLPYHTVHEVP